MAERDAEASQFLRLTIPYVSTGVTIGGSNHRNGPNGDIKAIADASRSRFWQQTYKGLIAPMTG